MFKNSTTRRGVLIRVEGLKVWGLNRAFTIFKFITYLDTEDSELVLKNKIKKDIMISLPFER